MAVYIVTGKLGGGKTLAAVSKIDEALGKGHRVATNLDLELVNLPSVKRNTKNCRVIRVPDRPSVEDIQAIGFGIEGVTTLQEARKSYNEDKFGLLVLDECGTWLNSRDWQAEGRRELINFLLHIRKHLWHVYLIIQDISMLDKQARKALAEFVVYCRRMDRLKVPFVGSFVAMFTGKPLTLPKMHMAIVKYGDQPQSLLVDRWWYKGSDLFDGYDTTQVFSEDYDAGLHSLLPPWYRYQHAFVTWNRSKILKLTQIYLRQYSRTLLLAAGVCLGAVMMIIFAPEEIITSASELPVAGNDVSGVVLVESVAADQDNRVPLIHRLRIDSILDDSMNPLRVTFTDGQRVYTDRALQAIGVRVALVGRYRYRLEQDNDYAIVTRF